MNTAQIIILANNNGLSINYCKKCCLAFGELFSNDYTYLFEDNSVLEIKDNTLIEQPF